MNFAGQKSNFKKIFHPVVAVIISLMIFSVLSMPVFAATKNSKKDAAQISVNIPSGFSSYTSTDIEKSSDYFKDMPISKNDAIKRVGNGVLINAFSDDKTREIRVTVSTNETSAKINNFSAMSLAEQKSFATSFTDLLKEDGHIFLSTPTVIELSGYSFIKYYARIGDSKIGYTYTSIMTIIGGKCYELTCYNNVPVLEQEQIDANEAVISTFKIKIDGNNGEIATNIFQTIVSYAIMIIAIAVIVGIIISFIRPIIEKRNADEPIKPQKRK